MPGRIGNFQRASRHRDSACWVADWVIGSLEMTIAFADGTVKRWRSHMRPLIALAVIYALVIQVFVAALGPRLAIGSDSGLAVELCAHNNQGAPIEPSDLPDRPCVQHCIFCLASSSVALAAPGASADLAAEIAVGQVSWPAHAPSLPQPSRYAIARPRGPPSSA